MLLTCTLDSTAGQHAFSVNLDGIVLKLDSRSAVIAVVPISSCVVDDPEVLAEAA
jgi:hypothetical protein